MRNAHWMGRTLPTAVIVDEFLQQLTPLEKQLGQQANLAEKLAQHQQSIEDYTSRLVSLADQLSIKTKNISPDQLYQTLATRMEKATVEQESLHSLHAQKNTLLEQQKIIFRLTQ